jgi:hypothetical protein
MYNEPMAKFELKLVGEPEEIEKLLQGGNVLRSLCQKEVESFNEYLQQFAREQPDIGSDYETGLARFEKDAIGGYLYQKLRGRVGEKNYEVHNDDRRKDGTP